MLFVTLGTPKQGSTMKQRLARRMDWTYPAGVKIIGEYWLELAAPTLLVVLETDDPAALVSARVDWDDHFDFTTVPAISADQGMEFARKLAAR